MMKSDLKRIKESEEILRAYIPDLPKAGTKFSLPGGEGETWNWFKKDNGEIGIKRLSTDENFSNIDVVSIVEKVDFKGALQIIEDKFPNLFSENTANKTQVNITIEQWFKEHGLKKEIVEKYGCKLEREQIKFPIQTDNGIKFHIRLLNSNKKFICDDGLKVSEDYFVGALKGKEKLLVAAGEADAINLSEEHANEFDVIGVLGETNRPKKLFQIVKNYQEIYVLFDNDETGLKSGYDLCSKLAKHTLSKLFYCSFDTWSKVAKDINDVSELKARIGSHKFIDLIKHATELREESTDELQIEAILNSQNLNLDIKRVFSTDLGKLIELFCADTTAPIEYFLNDFIAACSSLLGRRSLLEITDTYIEKPILWFCNSSSDPSFKKSPVLEFVLSPLRGLEGKEYKEYITRREEYDNQLDDWKATDKKERGEKPTLIGQRRFITDDFTPESLRQIGEGNIFNESFLVCKDEGTELFKLDAYKKNSGTGKEMLLQLWNGNSKSVDRVGKDPIYIRYFLSLVINIIEADLKRFVVDDLSGLGARFLYVSPKKPPFQRPQNNHLELKQKLEHVFQNIQNYTENLINADNQIRYRLSPEAVEHYFQIAEKMDSLTRKPELSRAYKAWIGKATSHLCRLALVLHVLEQALSGSLTKQILIEISGATFLRAIYLFNFYKNNAFRLLGLSSDQKVLDKCLEIAKTSNGTITKAQLSQTKLLNGDEIDNFFKRLQEEGYGHCEKFGTKKPGLKFVFDNLK